jgi:hypothetical protein
MFDLCVDWKSRRVYCVNNDGVIRLKENSKCKLLVARKLVAPSCIAVAYDLVFCGEGEQVGYFQEKLPPYDEDYSEGSYPTVNIDAIYELKIG